MSARYFTIQQPARSTANLELANLAALQAFLNVSGDATRMATVVNAINESVFNYLRNRIVLDSTEDYELILDGPQDSRTLLIPIRPVVSISVLERGYYSTGGWQLDKSFTGSEYILELDIGKVTLLPSDYFSSAQKSIRCVFRAGYTVIPAGMKQAVLEIMAVEYKRISGDRLDSTSVGTGASSHSYTFDSWPSAARRELDRYISKVGLL